MQKASGLAEHGKSSKKPFPYTHLDIAGTAMSDQDYIFGKPTGTPIVALSAQYVVPRLAQAAKFALKL
jgi:leucyl aminopeptidase